MAPERISEVTAYILEHFDQKTKRGEGYYTFSKLMNIEDVARNAAIKEQKEKLRLNGFNSIFAVSSIEAAKLYYMEFKRQMAAHP
jgi:type I restriction enzyme R subunit